MNKLLCSLTLPALAGFLVQGAALAQQTQEYEPLVKVAPVYPESALADGLEGHVVVDYTISAEGAVEDARVAESSNAVFDDAAVESVKKYTYRPRVLNGERVAVTGVRVRVLFRLPVEH